MSIRKMWLVVPLILATILGLSPRLAAQNSAATGSINGTIVDSTGGSIVGASITVEGPQGNSTYTTNSAGTFIAGDLIPGTYAVRSEVKGFKVSEVSGVTVNVGHVTAMRVVMEPGTVTQTVEVVGSGVTVDTSSTAVASNLNDDFYQKLPVQRNVAGLFYLAPGVVTGGGTGASNPSIGGATGLENLYIADGVSITDTAFGGLGVYSRVYGSVGTGINLSFVKEVQVKTGSIQPQYGGATGGVVQIVTKSGGQQYHGAIAGYWQPKQLEATRLNADDFNLANPTGKIIHSAAWDVSGEFGGPVPFVGKDKLFFFGSFDPTKDQSYRLAPPLTGNSAFGTVQGAQLFYNYAAKLTFKINDKNTIEGSVFGDPETSNFFPWARLREGAAGIPNTTNFSKLDFGNRDVVARYNGTLSPTWILNLDATWQHNKFTEKNFDNTLSEITDQTQTLVGPPGGQGIAANVQAGQFTPVGKGFTENTEDDAYGAHINTTKIVNFWGQHSFDVGYGYNRPFYKGQRLNTGPAITPPDLNQDGKKSSSQCTTGPGSCPWDGLLSNYNWTLNMVPGCPTGGATPVCALMTVPGFTTPQPVALELFRGEFGVNANSAKTFTTTGRIHAAYAADTWTINKYVTVNAGLRWQTEKLIGQNTKYTFTDNWSPSMGVTVDPIGDRKNKLWVSFARYNYNLPLDLAERSLTNELDLFSLKLVPDFTVDATGNRVVALNSLVTVTPIVDAAHTLNRAAGSPFGGIFGSLESLESIHTGTKLTYEDEYVMGGEHEFSHGVVLTVRYMHRSLRRIVEDTGGIAPEAANAGVPQQFSITNPSKGLDIFTNPIQEDFTTGQPVTVGTGAAAANFFPDASVIPSVCKTPGSPATGPINVNNVPFFDFPTNSFGQGITDGQGNNAACFAADGNGINGQPAGGVVPDGIPDGFADPVHKYWSVVFEVNKSFSRNWQLRANYTISKVFGNFEGAFRNDNGQSDPGISSLFDFTTGQFNQLGGQFTPGLLNQDRQQVANGYFSYVFDHGKLKNLSLGSGVGIQTGTPVTELAAHPVYLNSGEIPIGGRGALGRTPTIGKVDVHADYVAKLTERFSLRFGIDMFNLTNSKRVNFFNQNIDLKFGVPNADFLKPGNIAVLGDAIQAPFNARAFFRLEF
jgi:hypothetical protein